MLIDCAEKQALQIKPAISPTPKPKQSEHLLRMAVHPAHRDQLLTMLNSEQLLFVRSGTLIGSRVLLGADNLVQTENVHASSTEKQRDYRGHQQLPGLRAPAKNACDDVSVKLSKQHRPQHSKFARVAAAAAAINERTKSSGT